jgi:hypothetical protein
MFSNYFKKDILNCLLPFFDQKRLINFSTTCKEYYALSIPFRLKKLFSINLDDLQKFNLENSPEQFKILLDKLSSLRKLTYTETAKTKAKSPFDFLKKFCQKATDYLMLACVLDNVTYYQTNFIKESALQSLYIAALSHSNQIVKYILSNEIAIPDELALRFAAIVGNQTAVKLISLKTKPNALTLKCAKQSGNEALILWLQTHFPAEVTQCGLKQNWPTLTS